MQKYYQIDLSKIHDEGFYQHSTRSFPFIIKTINRFHKKGLVVELGCGSGIIAKKLIENNYSVLGIDYSASMIKLAKQKVPKAKFLISSIHRYEIPKCIAVLAIGEVFNYSFDNNTNYRSLKKLFLKVYNSLEKNGIFIFDVLKEDQIKNNRINKTFTEGKNWLVLTEKKENKRRKELERRIITFYRIGKVFRKREETHKVKLYNTSILIKLLNEIGFNSSYSRNFGKYKLGNNHAIFVCRK